MSKVQNGLTPSAAPNVRIPTGKRKTTADYADGSDEDMIHRFHR
jgi:hypothetical protein